MSAPRISISGRYLDEVRTRVENKRPTRSNSLISLPARYHLATVDDDGLTLQTPAMTALQLFHDGVLGSGPVQIVLGSQDLGYFEIEWLRRLEGHEFGEPVVLRFRKNGD